jgi:hypothetical protein
MDGRGPAPLGGGGYVPGGGCMYGGATTESQPKIRETKIGTHEASEA